MKTPSKVVFSRTVIIPDIKSFINYSNAQAESLLVQHQSISDLINKRPLNAVEQSILLLKCRWHFASDIRLLKNEKPNVTVVWNGLKFRRALFVEAATSLSIPCIFMENGLLPNTTVCDIKGVNALNSMPRDKAFYLQRDVGRDQFLTQLVQRESKNVKVSSGKQLPDRFIFIPFQVDTDSQILIFSPWIQTMLDLFELMIKANDSIEGLQLVFKEHPSSPIDYSYLQQKLPDDIGIFANEYATQTLIERAEAIITINSTVGIESILLGKKVITLGDAFYNIPDLVYPVKNIEELTECLKHINELEPDKRLRISFLEYLSDHYLIKGSWKDANVEHCAETTKRLEAYHQQVC